MQRMDDLAAKAHALLLSASGKDLQIEAFLRFGWARFVYSLILRTPESLEKMRAALVIEAEKVVEEFREQYPKMRRPEDPEDFEEFKKNFLANPLNVHMQPFLHRMIDSERALTHIANMKWYVLDTWGAKDRLLTSDRPVMMTEGLGAENSHLVIPISPTLLFLAVNSENTRRIIGRLTKNQMVRINNQGVSEQAKKFVYGFSNVLRTFVSMHLGKQVPATPFDRM